MTPGAPELVLTGRDILNDTALSAEEFIGLLDLADSLEGQAAARTTTPRLVGRTIACLFEKASSRTRIALTVAAFRQGAQAMFLDSSSHLGHKESIADTVRLLDATCDAISYRGAAQSTIEQIADLASMPVYNMLTDDWHPTQMYADMLTMRRACTKPLSEISYAFIGDCRANVPQSHLVAAALLGMDIRMIAPTSLQPSKTAHDTAAALALASGARITITDDISAVEGVDVVHTDVWVSMGEPESAWQQRADVLRPYRVTSQVLQNSGNPQVKFMHCLPAFHDSSTTIGAQVAAVTGLHDGIEVSDEVFASSASLVWQQAAARVCTTEALLVATLA
jgi:ornithine carbamoyltransferase